MHMTSANAGGDAIGLPRGDSVFEGISAVLLGVCGPILFVVIPFFLTLLKDSRGFTESQVSLISSADMLGMFIASSLAAFWIKEANWRWVSVASLVLLIVATTASLYAQGFALFGLSRIVAGFGAGSLMGIGLTAMGDRLKADAWFGWFVAAQAVLGSLSAWIIPRFIQPHGLTALLMMMIGVYIVLIPFALSIPKRKRIMAVAEAEAEAMPTQGASLGLAVLSLVGAFAFYMGVFAIWSHIGLIGRAEGIDPTRIGNAVSLGYLIGIPASFGAVLLAGRLNRAAFFGLIGAIHLAALAILFIYPAYSGFLVATLLLGWLWYFAAPPQMGVTVSVDPSGRFIVLFVAAMKSSYVAAGAVLSILLAGGSNMGRVIIFSALCGAASLGIYLVLAAKAPRRREPA